MQTFRWAAVEAEAPEFAARVVARFDTHPHKFLATVRADGSPRISGINLLFAEGDVWWGTMPDSRKLDDVRRDPRVAIHAAPDAEELTAGDVKFSGVCSFEDPARMVALWEMDAEQAEATGGGELLRVELRDLTLTWVDHEANEMVIETFRPGAGVETTRRT